MATHLAAVTLAKGEPFEIQTRPTPKPGPGELLIGVKSVALNPADAIMRDHGLFIPTYPTVIGFDMSGLVLEVGDNVPVSATDGPLFRPGITRVAVYAASFWKSFDPDYGVFQEQCLVPWQHAVSLPDDGISWNQAATLPVAVQVPLNAWDVMGIPRAGEATGSSSVSTTFDSKSLAERTQKNKEHKREALLVWGASSSVGTMGVQSARLLRDDGESSFAAVYATAGAANHEYVRALGADRVFDYKEPLIVEAIISAAEKDGLVINHCFLATGNLAPCQAVLKAFVQNSEGGKAQKRKIASAPVVPPNAEVVEGIETIFVVPSMDESERLAHFQYCMGTWLRENLGKGTIKPSPEPRVVGKGLEAINAGLNILLGGKGEFQFKALAAFAFGLGVEPESATNPGRSESVSGATPDFVQAYSTLNLHHPSVEVLEDDEEPDVDDEDEFDDVPLHRKRAFGAGLKRQRVEFVPAQEPDQGITATTTAKPDFSIGDLYASVVMKKTSPATDPGPAEDPVPSKVDEPRLCPICALPTTASSRPHEASLAHQVCVTHSHPPSALDRSRMGLRALAAQGWNPDARQGLGRGGEGMRYPIKVVAKEDTLGVGAKVPEGVRRREEKPTALNPKEMRQLAERERAKGLRLQRELFGSVDVERYREGRWEWGKALDAGSDRLQRVLDLQRPSSANQAPGTTASKTPPRRRVSLLNPSPPQPCLVRFASATFLSVPYIRLTQLHDTRLTPLLYRRRQSSQLSTSSAETLDRSVPQAQLEGGQPAFQHTPWGCPSLNSSTMWKCLIVDEHSKKIIDNSVKEDDILNNNIATIERIEDRRDPNPEMDAVYVLTPDNHAVECLLADLEMHRYRSYHMVWTGLLDPSLRRRIDDFPGFRQVRAGFQTLYIDFYPRESHLITFRDPWSFPMLYHPGCNMLVPVHMKKMAEKLAGLCITLGEYPKVRYYRPTGAIHEASVLSAHLARFIQEELDAYAQWNTNFPPPSQRPQATLVITDRSMDLMAPLVHEFTYQAMAHDLLPIKEGDKVTFHTTINQGAPDEQEKDMELGEKDKIWVDNRHRHMKDTIDKLMGDFQKFLQQNPHFTNEEADTTSLNAIRDMLAGLPQFQEMKEAHRLGRADALDGLGRGL
ncbi:hypothetical protein G7046_g5396 [Stylonectria norvegica]|nr:hypothetical protein G7046_g5396 [Stylonectria norvegica]